MPFTGSEAPDQFAIAVDEIEEMLAAGGSIASANLYDPRVATLAVALKAQLNLPGGVAFGAMLSPKGEGWPSHVDRSSAFTIQCEGRKRFVVSTEPVVRWPRGSIIFDRDGAPLSFSHDPEPWERETRAGAVESIDVVLEPGDVMYWPAGALHKTESLTRTSLNLNFALNHADFYWIITQFIRAKFGSDPAWRHLPLVGPNVAEPGRLPKEAASFFADRLQELVGELRSLSPDGLTLTREWHRLIAEPGEGTIEALDLDSPAVEYRPVEKDETLGVSSRAPITFAQGRTDDGCEVLTLYFANKEVTVYAGWVPFIRAMIEKKRFVAASACEWTRSGQPHPWLEVQAYLDVLLSHGFLERSTNN
jgi:hypothetical protein